MQGRSLQPGGSDSPGIRGTEYGEAFEQRCGGLIGELRAPAFGSTGSGRNGMGNGLGGHERLADQAAEQIVQTVNPDGCVARWIDKRAWRQVVETPRRYFPGFLRAHVPAAQEPGYAFGQLNVDDPFVFGRWRVAFQERHAKLGGGVHGRVVLA
jgi:hypothetical protein